MCGADLNTLNYFVRKKKPDTKPSHAYGTFQIENHIQCGVSANKCFK